MIGVGLSAIAKFTVIGKIIARVLLLSRPNLEFDLHNFSF